MARRGQCRCGAILRFQKTKQGYKTRCPACSAVVRLRAGAASGPPPLPSAAPDLSALSDHESTAPQALAEMDAYHAPQEPAPARWWLFVLAAAVVIVGVGTAALLWG